MPSLFLFGSLIPHFSVLLLPDSHLFLSVLFSLFSLILTSLSCLFPSSSPLKKLSFVLLEALSSFFLSLSSFFSFRSLPFSLRLCPHPLSLPFSILLWCSLPPSSLSLPLTLSSFSLFPFLPPLSPFLLGILLHLLYFSLLKRRDFYIDKLKTPSVCVLAVIYHICPLRSKFFLIISIPLRLCQWRLCRDEGMKSWGFKKKSLAISWGNSAATMGYYSDTEDRNPWVIMKVLIYTGLIENLVYSASIGLESPFKE